MIQKENVYGWTVVFISLTLTLVIWLTTLKSFRWIEADPFLFCSKAVVLPGIILMCWSFFLSTRLKVFEMLFGGLDKTYHAHKMVSIYSFTLICLHPSFQFFRFLPNYRKSLSLFIPKAFTALEFGLASLILFILLISLTLWIKIPYHIWKKTHEFFILVLLLALIHIYLIDKQIHDSYALMIWMYGFIGLAIFSYIYTRFLYRFLGPKYNYRITKIEKNQESRNVFLEPEEDVRMIYQPAQFIYVTFENEKLGKEPHPYSVSSAPHQTMRLSIKQLGDYTSRLDALSVGDSARVWGPYGRFYEKYLCQPDKNAVMIAGGIGITPFLSLLHHEIQYPKSRKTLVFYGVKNRRETDFVQEVNSLASQHPSIQSFIAYSEEKSLDVPTIMTQLDQNLKMYNFFLCGPIQMMTSFEKELKRLGVKNRQIIFEDFNLFD